MVMVENNNGRQPPQPTMRMFDRTSKVGLSCQESLSFLSVKSVFWTYSLLRTLRGPKEI